MKLSPLAVILFTFPCASRAADEPAKPADAPATPPAVQVAPAPVEKAPAAEDPKPDPAPPPAADKPAADKPAADKPAGEDPVLPPLDPSDPKNLPPIAPAPPVVGGDPITMSVVMDDAFQNVPLAGISLFLDRRVKATDPAPTWEKEQKDALREGVQVTDGLMTPDPEGLRTNLTKFIGKLPMTYGDLQEVVRIIQDHYRANNRPMTHVYIPKQSLFSSRVVISIVEGRVGDTSILTEADLLKKSPDQLTPAEKSFLKRMEGEKTWWNSWYNNPYKAEDVTAEFQPRTSQLQGRIVDTEEIKAQITGMNRSPWVRLNRPVDHPFRDVTVNFSQPGPNILGQTNLVFEVDDKRPLKFFAGVDNSLTEITGENRFFLGAAWYDAFLLGRNHQMGAQVFSALEPDELLGFSMNYQIPWQDAKFDQFTELFVSYAASTAEVTLGGVPTDTVGGSLIVGARHYLELPELLGASDLTKPLLDKRPKQWAKPTREALGYHHEVGAGFDFKSSDNDLEFGGSTVSESPADIVQLVLEYNARQTDPTGETNLSAQLFFSPGDVTDDNTDEAFSPLRANAEASYVYTRVRLEREQDLPFAGMMARAAITGQYASSNLLASEQMGLGGFSSVRGYPERALRGDLGWIINLELHSPEFHPARDWFGFTRNDMLKFIAFVDYAHGESVDENPADPLDDAADLMSVGLGIRYEFEDSLKLRLDYGFRMEDLPPAAANGDDGAIHFGLIYVF
ncbi:MAG: ShlB/FhaC/HecB family hemolysin secretion/activation protein [Verrucomicrobia bacterium]|nr:ShlB/FhaC/HecB family hemolysin secretion/activation protein [Verrucomicrobiota bacterium]